MLLLSQLSTGAFAEACRPVDNEQLPPGAFTIGTVSLSVNNIFNPRDPAETTWLHKLGNQLHIQSREKIIRQQLLFHSGSPYDPQKLKETERILRQRRYIKSAEVRAIEVCGDKVNVQVTTWDRWTFTPSVEFGRTGGENSTSFDIEEQNLLGLGKYFRYLQEKNVDRITRELNYVDEQFLGSWKTLDLSLHHNSDGNGHRIELAQPFFSLDSRQAWKINTASQEGDVFLYEKGKVADRFHQRGDSHEISYGWSDGLESRGSGAESHSVSRYRLGWFYRKDDFSPVPNVSRGEVADDRLLNYPWISYQHLNERFIKIQNLTLMDSIDDVALGHDLTVLLGVSPKGLGSDSDYIITDIAYQRGLQPTPRQLLQLSLRQTNVFGSGSQHDSALKALGSWHFFRRSRRSYVLSAQWESHTHLSRDQQILLGGDSGLRGYPLRYQSGTRKFLLSAEGRHQHRWYPLHLVQFASAVFVDAGSAWNAGEDPDILADVGIGTRIFPTHASGKTVIHIDLAFPLHAPDGISGVQFVVETKQAF